MLSAARIGVKCAVRLVATFLLFPALFAYSQAKSMRVKRLLISAFKLLFLIAVAGALYAFNRSRQSDLPVIDDDDVNVTAQVTVQTGKITERTLRQYADVYGVVEAEPARDGKPAAGAIITAPVSMLVTSVGCTEGAQVRAGQTLLKLDTRSASADVDRAAAMFNAAAALNTAAKSDDRILPRDKLRFERDLTDASAGLAQARAAMDRLVIASPISGTVLRLNVRTGEVAVAGRVAMEIADENRLQIACAVPAWLTGGIAVGASAEAVCLDTDGVEHITPAKVDFVDPSVDAASGSASIDVVLDSHATSRPAARLRVGQTVHVRLITASHDAMVVPEEAIVEDAQGHATISLVERDFRWAVRRAVETGLRDDGWVEVKARDLAAGQDVVTLGAFALTDKCRIEVTR